jgi:large subunit ribosomal protein L30
MSRSPATERASRRSAPPSAGPAATVRVTYRKSAIGYAHDQRATVVALGLHRLHQTVEHPDTPALRGMVRKVRHLVSVDGVPADSPELAARLAAGGPLGSGGAPPEARP